MATNPPQFGLLPCMGFPVRKGEVSVLEWSAAELYMQTGYRWEFAKRHPNPRWALVLSAGPRFFESSYFEYLIKATDRSLGMPIQVLLKFLLSDFRNPLPQQRLIEFERAYRAGKLTPELVFEQMNFIRRPGGMRKPDILGLTTDSDPGRLELMEVSSVGTLGGTKKELDSKLQQLRSQVIPLAEAELSRRQTELRQSVDPLIHSFTAEAGTWAPPRELRACPLGVSYDAQQNVTKVTWACFEPAIDQTSQTLASPGLLPYHIHEIERPRLDQVLPTAVQVDLRRWQSELARSRGLRPLELLPEANPSFKTAVAGWTAEQRLLGYGIVAVASLAAVYLMVVAAPIVLELVGTLGAPAAGAALPAAPALGAATGAALPAASVLIRAIPSVVTTTQSLYPVAADYATSVVRVIQSAPPPPPPPM